MFPEVKVQWIFGTLLTFLFSISATAQEPGTIVVATGDTFICPSREDAQFVGHAAHAAGDERLKQKIGDHLCSVVQSGVPLAFRSGDEEWVQLSIPGIPNISGWSPRDRFAQRK